MMEMAIYALAAVLMAAGAFFFIVAGLGLVRMPDVFTRMHAGGIADTAGAGLLLGGMALATTVMMPFADAFFVVVKLLVILLVVLFTSPIVTHALAQAALHAGVEPKLANKPAAKRRPRKNQRKAKEATR